MSRPTTHIPTGCSHVSTISTSLRILRCHACSTSIPSSSLSRPSSYCHRLYSLTRSSCLDTTRSGITRQHINTVSRQTHSGSRKRRSQNTPKTASHRTAAIPSSTSATSQLATLSTIQISAISSLFPLCFAPFHLPLQFALAVCTYWLCSNCVDQMSSSPSGSMKSLSMCCVKSAVRSTVNPVEAV